LELYHTLQKGNNSTDKALIVFGPTTIFGFILATLFGAGFHLLVGGDARRLALFLLAGWVGFGLGHLLGVMFSINLFNIGTLHITTAAFGAILALLSAYALTSDKNRKRSTQ
jgi:hypothetical protein